MKKSILKNLVVPAVMLVGVACPVIASENLRPASLSLEEVLARHYEARGGLEKIRSIHAYRMTGTLRMPAQGAEMALERVFQRPDDAYLGATFQGGGMIQVHNGEIGWFGQTGGVLQAMPAEDAKHFVLGSKFDGVLLELDPAKTRLLGREESDGRDFHVIQTHVLDTDVTLYIDSETHLLSQGKTGRVVFTFEDYRKVGGVMVSHAMERRRDGMTQEVKFDAIDLNAKVDEALFTAPELASNTGSDRDTEKRDTEKRDTEKRDTEKRDTEKRDTEKRAILATIEDYAQGADERDAVRLARSLHDESRQYLMLPNGFTSIDKKGYLGALEAGRIGGKPRTMEVRSMDLLDARTATARVELKSKLTFLSVLGLLKVDGAWQIVSVLTSVQGL